MLTEDYYVFNKLAKGLVGTNNVDNSSRLGMSSSVAGYEQTLGADVPPCTYEDIAAFDVIFIAADPRRSETAQVAVTNSEHRISRVRAVVVPGLERGRAWLVMHRGARFTASPGAATWTKCRIN